MQERPVKMINRIAYSVGDFYGGGGLFLVSILAMYFLINIVKLPPLYAGLIFGISRILDAIADPLMGYLSDHTKSRLGRRRIYFAWGIIPIIISFNLVWYPVHISDVFLRYLYYQLAYIFFYFTTTMVLIPYYALNAEMTTNYAERNRLSGMRLMFSIAATLIVAVAAMPFVKSFPDPETGYRMLGIAAGFFCAIPWIFVILGTWELPIKSESEDLNFISNFVSIFRNKSFLLHIGMFICAYGCFEVLKSWFIFYTEDYLLMPKFQSIGMGVIIITELLAVNFYTWYANKKSTAAAYILGMAIFIPGMILFAMHPPNASMPLLIANCVLVGFGIAAGVFIPWAILPFVVDVDELITGKNRAGTYSGGLTFIRKFMQGVVALILGVLLQFIGYVSKVTPEILQTPETIFKFKIMFVSLPVIFTLAGLFFALRFKITPTRHRVMMAEIERLRGGGSKADVSPDTRRVCERLTGLSYEKLFMK